MPPPLAEEPLAVFPFRATGPRPPEPGLRLGLIDLLLYDLQDLTDGGQSDPLSLHILSHTFQRAHPGAGPDEYARWTGADRTLLGSLVDLGEHRVRMGVQIFDRNGRSLYEADPVTVDLRDLQSLRHALLSGAIEGLELTLPAALPPLPVASPVTLQLHAEALQNYVTEQVPKAHERLTGARKLEPTSPLLSRTHSWAALYLEGEEGSGIPIHIYMELGKQPDPSEALQRRLQATHSLIVPSPGAQTGSESPHPYKPPRTEGAP